MERDRQAGGGEIWFDGEDLLKKSPAEMRKIRGNEISMIFQEPMTSLNPVFTIEGSEVVLNPLEIVSVPVEGLKDRVDSLAGEGDAIIAALDELFSRAWR